MIEIKNLNKTYDRRRAGENHVLHDISFTLPDTGFVCILGPSGCGKTSLLNAIGGLDRFDNGTIATADVSVNRYGTALYEAERNRSFGYIFQNYYLLPEHSVGYNVYLGLHSLDLSHAQKIKRVKDALKAVEMDRYIRRNVGELSGGQQQRVAIARALARKPRVIFADEPTGNLDETNTINICSLLRRISRKSLVVMVTHEERIAQFFADRIISLDAGRIQSDTTQWQRQPLSAGATKAVYTGDYRESRWDADRIHLRLFQAEGVAPVNISLVALHDRIVIKLDDDRAVSCGSSQDPPVFIEGKRPIVTLEEVEEQAGRSQFDWENQENISAGAGKSIRFRDMLREAIHMNHGKKFRSLGTKIFLILLTVLLALSVADVVTIATIEPEDFITSHSQALEVKIDRGTRAGSSTANLQNNARIYKEKILKSNADFVYVPNIAYSANISGSPILQANKVAVTLEDFSYAPLEFLEESTLVMGRLPQTDTEVVVDIWVLENVLAREGVGQNIITDISFFLDNQIDFTALNVSLTIVGICDGAEPAVYISDAMFASIGASGTEVITLPQLQAMYPGEFTDVTLKENECLVITANAGEGFADGTYQEFSTVCGSTFAIAGSVDKTDCYAKIVVAPEAIDGLMVNMSMSKFWIYAENKEEVKAYLEKQAQIMGDVITVTVTDLYGEKMAQYAAASQQRLDGRTIITVTVMLLSVVMLYLLRRADVYGSIGMLSVYRLLGIPARKAVGIFCIESAIGSLSTALPAAAGFWLVIALLRSFGVTSLVFPWPAALGVYGCILVFHLILTTLPLKKLMTLPPAVLAAKYDF